MFAIYIFTFMYNSLVENGIKKKNKWAQHK